jgi:hypothetical protein
MSHDAIINDVSQLLTHIPFDYYGEIANESWEYTSAIEQLGDLLHVHSSKIIFMQSEHEYINKVWLAKALCQSKMAHNGRKKQRIYQFRLPQVMRQPEYVSALFEEIFAIDNDQCDWLYVSYGEFSRWDVLLQEQLINIVRSSASKVRLLISEDHKCFFDKDDAGFFKKLTLPLSTVAMRQDLLNERLLQQYHSLVISQHALARTLEWVSRFHCKEHVFSQSLAYLDKAITRAGCGIDEGYMLEPHHIADVIADWQELPLSELLRPLADSKGLDDFLQEHLFGQDLAVTTFVKNQLSSNMFAFVGPEAVGKHRFAKKYACYSNGATSYCFKIDLRWCDWHKGWDNVFVASPSPRQEVLSVTQVIKHFPKSVFYLTGLAGNHKGLVALFRFIDQVYRLGRQKVDASQVTWIFSLDVSVNDYPQETLTDIAPSAEKNKDLSDVLAMDMDKLERGGINRMDVQTCQKLSQQCFEKDIPELLHDSVILVPFMPLTSAAQKQALVNAFEHYLIALQKEINASIHYQAELIVYLLTALARRAHGLRSLNMLFDQHVKPIILTHLSEQVLQKGEKLMLVLNDRGQKVICRKVGR